MIILNVVSWLMLVVYGIVLIVCVGMLAYFEYESRKLKDEYQRANEEFEKELEEMVEKVRSEPL